MTGPNPGHTFAAGSAMLTPPSTHDPETGARMADQPPQTPAEPTTAVARYADKAMFAAEPLAGSDGPAVFVLAMNPDPLGSAAAAVAMYRGQVVRDLAEVTDDQRREVLTSMQATKLKAPLEFIKIHMLLENVHRGFTHQMVRQRTAVYAQESMRFAVKEGLANAVHLPPSLAEFNDPAAREAVLRERAESEGFHPPLWSEKEKQFIVWWDTAQAIEKGYTELINTGMPAEEARGLAPTNIGTRLHYATDFRALLDHAGNRLCTQAQFEWRQVFTRISSAIVKFGENKTYQTTVPEIDGGGLPSKTEARVIRRNSLWQFQELARLFRPACYLTGKCEFAAMDLDRACNIRDRVDAFHAHGVPSSQWDRDLPNLAGDRPLLAIHPAEWLLDDAAARER